MSKAVAVSPHRAAPVASASVAPATERQRRFPGGSHNAAGPSAVCTRLKREPNCKWIQTVHCLSSRQHAFIPAAAHSDSPPRRAGSCQIRRIRSIKRTYPSTFLLCVCVLHRRCRIHCLCMQIGRDRCDDDTADSAERATQPRTRPSRGARRTRNERKMTGLDVTTTTATMMTTPATMMRPACQHHLRRVPTDELVNPVPISHVVSASSTHLKKKNRHTHKCIVYMFPCLTPFRPSAPGGLYNGQQCNPCEPTNWPLWLGGREAAGFVASNGPRKNADYICWRWLPPIQSCVSSSLIARETALHRIWGPETTTDHDDDDTNSHALARTDDNNWVIQLSWHCQISVISISIETYRNWHADIHNRRAEPGGNAGTHSTRTLCQRRRGRTWNVNVPACVINQFDFVLHM